MSRIQATLNPLLAMCPSNWLAERVPIAPDFSSKSRIAQADVDGSATTYWMLEVRSSKKPFTGMDYASTARNAALALS